jgi:FAD/FMN-containing dehydrogenase
MLSVIESVTLLCHDFFTKAAAAVTLDPEIRDTAMQGRAEVKDARKNLEAAKAARSAAIKDTNQKHTLERVALHRKQATELECVQIEQACKVEDARETVKSVKQTARLRIEDIRARHEMARLQERLRRHGVSFTNVSPPPVPDDDLGLASA